MKSQNKNIHYQALCNICFLYKDSIKNKIQIWNAIHERNEKQLNEWIDLYIPKFSKYIQKDPIQSGDVYGYKQADIYFKVWFKTRIKKGGYGEIWESRITFIDDSLVVQQNIIKKGKVSRIFDGLRELIIHNELYCHFKKVNEVRSCQFIPEMTCMFRTKKHFCIGMERMDGTLFDYINHLLEHKKQTVVIEGIQTAIQACCNMIMRLQDSYRFMHRDFHGGNIMYRYDNERNEYKWYIIDFGMTCIETKTGRIYPPTESKHYKMIHGFNPSHDLRLLFLSIYGHFRDRLPRSFILLCFHLFRNTYHYLFNSFAYDNGVTTENKEYFFYRAYGEVVHINDPIFTPTHLRKCIQMENYSKRNEFIKKISKDAFFWSPSERKGIYHTSALRKSFKLFSL